MKRWIGLALLVLSPLLFADMGPGPALPEITVHLVQGQQPYTGLATLTYHCISDDNRTGTALSDRDNEFTCSDGVCQNEFWFYKFNPCFYPSDGYFEYNVSSGSGGGTGMHRGQSMHFAFPEGKRYDIILDVNTGQATVSSSAACLPFFLVGGIGLMASATILGDSRKRVWN